MARRKAGRRRNMAIAMGAAVAATAAGGAVLVARRRGITAPWRSGAQPETWTCTCGTTFRVAGAGRHQVLWLVDAPEDEPGLGDRCPSCDRALPGSPGEEHPVATPPAA